MRLAPLLLSLSLLASCASTPAQAERVRWWGETRLGLLFVWEPFGGEAPTAEEVERFNPLAFDADRWVGWTERSGATFALVRSTTASGFPLYDAAADGPDVLSTAFRRDPLAELAEVYQRHYLRFGWQHVVPPDQDPEAATAEVVQLLANYGDVDLLWLDVSRARWTRPEQRELGSLVRAMPIDTAVGGSDLDLGSGGAAFEVLPPAALDGPVPRRAWAILLDLGEGGPGEDAPWRDSGAVVRALARAVARGGNVLLTVHPTSQGEIPEPESRLLVRIGRWMTGHGEALRGTRPGPFERLEWGYCTQRRFQDSDRLFLFVLDWPADRILRLPGLAALPSSVRLVGSGRRLEALRLRGDVLVTLPETAPPTELPVVVVDFEERVVVHPTPLIEARGPRFVEPMTVTLVSREEDVVLRYTLDGSPPDATSAVYSGPFELDRTATVAAASFRGDAHASSVARRLFERVELHPALEVSEPVPGLELELFEGDAASRASRTGTVPTRVLRAERAALEEPPPGPFVARARGFLRVPEDDVYHFTVAPGVELTVADEPVSPGHRGLALEAGWHSLRIEWRRAADPGLLLAPLGEAPRAPRPDDLTTGVLR